MDNENRTLDLRECEVTGPDRRLPLGMLVLSLALLWFNNHEAMTGQSFAPMLTFLCVPMALISIAGLFNPLLMVAGRHEYKHRVPPSYRWFSTGLFVIGAAIGAYIVFGVYQ